MTHSLLLLPLLPVQERFNVAATKIQRVARGRLVRKHAPKAQEFDAFLAQASQESGGKAAKTNNSDDDDDDDDDSQDHHGEPHLGTRTNASLTKAEVARVRQQRKKEAREAEGRRRDDFLARLLRERAEHDASEPSEAELEAARVGRLKERRSDQQEDEEGEEITSHISGPRLDGTGEEGGGGASTVDTPLSYISGPRFSPKPKGGGRKRRSSKGSPRVVRVKLGKNERRRHGRRGHGKAHGKGQQQQQQQQQQQHVETNEAANEVTDVSCVCWVARD